MGNLEQVLAPNQVISDSIFLRVNRRGLSVYGHACLRDVDVVIFVFSLTSYYQFSDGDTKTVRGILALIE